MDHYQKYKKYKAKYLMCKKQQVGGNWECNKNISEKNRQCKNIGTEKGTNTYNVYSTEQLCHNDCEILPLDEYFHQVIPLEFELRLEKGGDLHDEFIEFSVDPNRLNGVISNINKTEDISRVKKIIDLFTKGQNINFIVTDVLQGFPEETRWDDNSTDILKDLPINDNELIGLPLLWRYKEAVHRHAAHIVTGIVNTKNKLLYIIDSNINYTINRELEEKLYTMLINIEGSKLNGYNIIHTALLECPIALQQLSMDGTCQTWQIYIMILSLINKNIPKKELIHITSLWDKKATVTALKQFLFYIYNDPLFRGYRYNSSFEFMSLENILIDVLSETHYRNIYTIRTYINTLTFTLETFKPFFTIGEIKNLEKGDKLNWIRYIFDILLNNFYSNILKNKANVYQSYNYLLWLIVGLQSNVISIRDEMNAKPYIRATNRKIYENIQPIILICIDNIIPEFKNYTIDKQLPYTLEIINNLKESMSQDNILIVSGLFYRIMQQESDFDDIYNIYQIIEDGLDKLINEETNADRVEKLRQSMILTKKTLEILENR